ncbi:MAG: glycosyltransferase family 2 protein [Planctomycetes bacterium]|nr:glycosyltransferase family 2 protein [Planctomycetota bacterium]
MKQCLMSIATCDGLDRISRVIVVDNGSDDGSCDDLPVIPVPLSIIRNGVNRGFAAGCNIGAAYCQTDYILFLNPDSVLLSESICVPLDFLDDPRNHDVGICGIQLVDGDGKVARSCSRLPTCYSMLTMALRLHGLSRRLFPPHFMKEWDHSQTRDVDQVIGAFFLVRSSLFHELGGFDERFFVYFEEVDFCERARQLAQRIVFLASARACHVGGGCSGKARGHSLFCSLRSRIAYAQKHYGRGPRSLVVIATLVAEPVIRIAFSLLKFRWANIPQLLYAFGKLWLDQIAHSVTT